MELWMYLVVIGMFLIAIIGTIWITLWTIQRGERARGERPDHPGVPRDAVQPAGRPADGDPPRPVE
jgi:hypothetical protein